jgi:NAD(P)-dependent dehydrogenase (short-subunit alcohol dehydrogenase family)
LGQTAAERAISALGAERALKTADARGRGVRRQVAIAAFAIGFEFQHRGIPGIHDAPAPLRRFAGEGAGGPSGLDLHALPADQNHMASSEQKTIFVTGAGSGIGRATALLFAERGWFVGLSDVDRAGLEQTAALLPDGQRISMLLDVRDRGQWARAMESFGHATGGRCHVLFNNAGVGRGGFIDEMSDDDIDLVLDVNLVGVINGVRAALPLLRQTPGARIVNTASVAGVVGAPRMSIYCATKFAVRGLTEALDPELSRYGVRVTSLMPWFVDTAILDNVGGPNSNRRLRDQLAENKTPIYPVRMAAERAWDAAHGSELHYMVGQAAERARFFARFFPGLVRKQVARSISEG